MKASTSNAIRSAKQAAREFINSQMVPGNRRLVRVSGPCSVSVFSVPGNGSSYSEDAIELVAFPFRLFR